MAAPRIIVAVGAVIEDGEGRVLLVKHKVERGGYWQGRWICPGGELEVGETIEEGIKREVMEETKMNIELVKPILPFERIVKTDGHVDLHVIYIDYLAKTTDSRVEVGSDVGEALWVDKRQIGDVWDEMHEDTRTLFELAGMVQ